MPVLGYSRVAGDNGQIGGIVDYAQHVRAGGSQMEKLTYVLWRDAHEPADVFNTRLLRELSAELLALGADRLSLNLVDYTVAPGVALRQENTHPMPAALASFWLNSAHIRAPLEAALQAAAARIAGYAVTESTVLPNIVATADGVRTRGFAQVALITRPPRLTPEGWLEVWLRDQTKVAVETQSNFYYCQNIVNRRLTHGAPDWHAIVEECFPIGALTDPQVFFDAVGDPQKYQANLDRMMQTCGRFIDFDKIDVILTSEYRFGGWADLDRGKSSVRDE